MYASIYLPAILQKSVIDDNRLKDSHGEKATKHIKAARIFHRIYQEKHDGAYHCKKSEDTPEKCVLYCGRSPIQVFLW